MKQIYLTLLFALMCFNLISQSASRQTIITSYQKAFGMDPDQASLTYWLGQKAYTLNEYVEMHRNWINQRPDQRKQIITTAYNAVYNQLPSNSDVAFWVGKGNLVYDEYISPMTNEKTRQSSSPTVRNGDVNMIANAYRQVLGREASSEELRYWQNQPYKDVYGYIESLRSNVAYGSNDHRNIVAAAFRKVYNTNPVESVFTKWLPLAFIRNKGVMIVEEVTALMTSELAKASGTPNINGDANMITNAYQQFFGRNPTSPELEYWKRQPYQDVNGYRELLRAGVAYGSTEHRNIVTTAYIKSYNKQPSESLIETIIPKAFIPNKGVMIVSEVAKIIAPGAGIIAPGAGGGIIAPGAGGGLINVGSGSGGTAVKPSTGKPGGGN